MAIFTKEEVKKNLLGSLEAALFMRETTTRFGNTADEAIRSIIRGLGYRATRSMPWWLAVAALVVVILMGGR